MKQKAVLYKKIWIESRKRISKNKHTTTHNKKEIWRHRIQKKFHQLVINNNKQQNKTDKKILMKKKQTQLR